jgi:hypothetical protein
VLRYQSLLATAVERESDEKKPQLPQNHAQVVQQPQSKAWKVSPSVPFNQFLRSRPSFFMCPIAGSMALCRRMSRLSCVLMRRLSLRW